MIQQSTCRRCTSAYMNFVQKTSQQTDRLSIIHNNLSPPRIGICAMCTKLGAPFSPYPGQSLGMGGLMTGEDMFQFKEDQNIKEQCTHMHFETHPTIGLLKNLHKQTFVIRFCIEIHMIKNICAQNQTKVYIICHCACWEDSIFCMFDQDTFFVVCCVQNALGCKQNLLNKNGWQAEKLSLTGSSFRWFKKQ